SVSLHDALPIFVFASGRNWNHEHHAGFGNPAHAGNWSAIGSGSDGRRGPTPVFERSHCSQRAGRLVWFGGWRDFVSGGGKPLSVSHQTHPRNIHHRRIVLRWHWNPVWLLPRAQGVATRSYPRPALRIAELGLLRGAVCHAGVLDFRAMASSVSK